MSKIYPFFELNGVRYEIKPTRYLLAEYDKLREQYGLSGNEQKQAFRLNALSEDVQKLKAIADKLQAKYLETYSKEDRARWKMAKADYEEAQEEFVSFAIESDSLNTLSKKTTDILEKIIIIGIAEQYNMSQVDAAKIWCDYVDIIGKEGAVEFLNGASECLFTADEEKDENPFLAQLRKKKR